MKAKILDCTLRDGAYLIDKHFGSKVIHGMVSGLVEAGIDIVETGFLQDDGVGEGKTVYFNSEDAEQYIPKHKGNTIFSVLADYSRYTIENLDEYTGKSFDAVRACFFKHEREGVLSFCRTIKEKGYKVFVQPVDILGYSDKELLELLENINAIDPYCFSIVDTFGSMYMEDLQRVYYIVDHNLISTAHIGFHSHNNLQLSSALTQEFLRLTAGKRRAIVDTTISGMGRGAGNTPTELIVQFMNSRLGYDYNVDAILDIIDVYMNKIRLRCEWGYNTPYFLAGCLSSHVNNVMYLLQKTSLRSKDIRYILNDLLPEERKRYDYGKLERKFELCMHSEIDDSISFEKLKKDLKGQNILVIAPGKTVTTERKKIKAYIIENRPKVIMINFWEDEFSPSYIYMNNVKRFQFWKQGQADFAEDKTILTSNVCEDPDYKGAVISFRRLAKCGWTHMDNSAILLLRLLDQLQVRSIGIAGMDGYSENVQNDYVAGMETENAYDTSIELNEEIYKMLKDFILNKKESFAINFLTTSKFATEEMRELMRKS